MTLDIGVYIYYNGGRAIWRGQILDFSYDRSRCFIIIDGHKNVSGMPIKTWVSTNDLKIDLEFYRDEKINKILNI